MQYPRSPFQSCSLYFWEILWRRGRFSYPATYKLRNFFITFFLPDCNKDHRFFQKTFPICKTQNVISAKCTLECKQPQKRENCTVHNILHSLSNAAGHLNTPEKLIMRDNRIRTLGNNSRVAVIIRFEDHRSDGNSGGTANFLTRHFGCN